MPPMTEVPMSAETMIGLAVLAVCCIAAWPYAQRAKHPAHKPVAAYVIFLTVVSVAIAVALSLMTALGTLAVPAETVASPAFIGISWVLSVAIGVVLGRFVLRLRPRNGLPK